MSWGVRRGAAAGVAALLLAGCSVPSDAGTRVSSTGSQSPVEAAGVTVYPSGSRPRIPELAGATLAGSTLSLTSLRGHVVVLNAWGSWCVPCRAESPILAAVARATAADTVHFVGLDEGDEPASAKAFVAATGTAYPHLLDRDGALLASLRLVPSSAVPSTLVLDTEGDVAVRVIGPVDASTFQGLVTAVVAASSATASPTALR